MWLRLIVVELQPVSWPGPKSQGQREVGFVALKGSARWAFFADPGGWAPVERAWLNTRLGHVPVLAWERAAPVLLHTRELLQSQADTMIQLPHPTADLHRYRALPTSILGP